MDVEIIDKRLVVTPTTHDDVRLIYAIAAAWTAFDAVICPVSGEPLRCNEDGTAESELPGVSGFLCLGRLFQEQPNEAALCI